MGMGDFLAGLAGGQLDDWSARKEKNQQDTQLAVQNKQGLGKLVLDGLVKGTVRPEVGQHVLGELQKLAEPRQGQRGLAGMMGGEVMPQTPMLDTLAGADPQAWGKTFYSPEELETRDATAKAEAEAAGYATSLRAKQKNLPSFIAHLVANGIPEDVARHAALKYMYGVDMFGASGNVGDYMDADGKLFRGKTTPTGGVMDVTTGQIMTGARAVRIDAQPNSETGELDYLDMYTGKVLSRAPGVVGKGFNGGMGSYFPQTGGQFVYDKRTGQAIWRPIEGQPNPNPQVNPEYEKHNSVLKWVDQQALDLERTLRADTMLMGDEVGIADRVRRQRDENARARGYADYGTLLKALDAANGPKREVTPTGPGGDLSTLTGKRPARTIPPNTPRGTGAADPPPSQSQGWKVDKDTGQQYRVVSPGAP
jgi:hypothetical protein